MSLGALKSLAKWSASSDKEVKDGKVELLIRFLEGTPFDEWATVTYLNQYQNTQPLVHDYVCNRLHELGEEAIEKFLLQFVYMAVSKPGQALERAIVDLCSKSFRVAIKAQWLLVALCQDHPKNKALESFRERAYKAALEGKWEVPIRNPKLDPLSPHNSQLLVQSMSPPFSPPFSPGTSMCLTSHLTFPQPHPQHHLLPPAGLHHHPHHNPVPVPQKQLQPPELHTPSHPGLPLQQRVSQDVAIQPPCSMVMSPPGPGWVAAAAAAAAAAACGGPGKQNGACSGSSGSGVVATTTADEPPEAGPGPAGVSGTELVLPTRRSGGLQLDLGCILDKQEQRGEESGAAASAPAGPPEGEGVLPSTEAAAAAGSGVAGSTGAALASEASIVTALTSPRCTAGGEVAAALNSVFGQVTREALAAAADVAAPSSHPGWTAAGVQSGSGLADSAPAATAAAAAHANTTTTSHAATAAVGSTVATCPATTAPVAGPASGSRVNALAAAANAVSAATNTLAERIQSLRRELGDGEGVSALLERSKQQGSGYVAATEEEGVMSDDEYGNRPMSPLSRVRFDTFGATLDFVEALCEASSTLTSYSQEERHRALRLGLECINRQIEDNNRRDVAIWFPMGRGGDRVLRLTAREAVLLNSREKAPFLLYVEVLEGQNECGGDPGWTGVPGASEAFGSRYETSSSSAAGGVASCVGGGATAFGGNGPQPSPAPVVEFGRRETYGIALTGIGAQHQHHFMHQTSPRAAAAGAAAAAAGAGAAAGAAKAHAPAGPGHLDGHDGCSQVGSVISGRVSLPSHGGPGTADTASTVNTDTPAALSPSASSSSQFRTSSRGGSPISGQPPPPPQQLQHGVTHGSAATQQQSALNHVLAAPTPTYACAGVYASLLSEERVSPSVSAGPATCGSGGGSVPMETVNSPPLATAPSLGVTLAISAAGEAASAAAAVAPASNVNGNNMQVLSSSAAMQASSSSTGMAPSSNTSMAAIFIPTRSASTSNMATVATVATAMASSTAAATASTTSTSGATEPVVPSLPQLSTVSAASSGAQSLTPRLFAPQPPQAPAAAPTASVAVLPPRPPPLPLPLGSMSPISAAKEVSPHGASHASGGMSNLLRRVMGDRVEDASGSGGSAGSSSAGVPAAGGGGAGGGHAGGSSGVGRASSSGFSVVRSLCFSNPDVGSPEHARDGEIASAAAAAAAATTAHLVSLPVLPALSGHSNGVSSGSSSGGTSRPHAVAGAAASHQPPHRAPLGPRGFLGGGGSSGGGAAQGVQGLGRHAGGDLTKEEVQELMTSGCLGHPSNKAVSDPIVASKLSRLQASLRGEAPMVRVRIRVLPQPPASHSQHQHSYAAAAASHPSAAAVASSGSGRHASQAPATTQIPGERAGNASGNTAVAPANAINGGPSMETTKHHDNADSPIASGSVSLPIAAVLGGRTKAASALAAAAAALPTPTGTSEESGGNGGGSGSDSGLLDKSKALALLSRFGLCRKPTAEDDMDNSGALGAMPASSSSGQLMTGPVGGNTVAAAVTAGSSNNSGGGAAVSSKGGGHLMPHRPWPVASAASGKLVQVSFEVAQGLNLAIPSPHRKSRRMPSHEAIEMLAGKYKIHQMPPPYECGPPLGPMPYSPGGRGAPTSYSLQERPSEEGEGLATQESEPSFSTTPVKGNTPGAHEVRSGAPPAASPVELQPQPPAAAAAAAAAATGTSSSSSSGLAASLQSSLTRMLSRAAGQQSQHASQHPEGSSSLASSLMSSMMSASGSRGGSPVRGGPAAAAAAATASQTPPTHGAASATNTTTTTSGSGAASRLAKLISGSSNSNSNNTGSSAVAAAIASASAATSTAASPAEAAAPAVAPSASAVQSQRSTAGGGCSSAAGTSSAGVPPVAALAPTSSVAAAAAATGLSNGGGSAVKGSAGGGRRDGEALEERRRREAEAVYGERWAAKVKRIQRESPHGCRAGWALRCVIVKSGDDCRQELLALQLVRTFGEIFREAGLPLWVRNYEVLVTSNKTALIEMVPNTLSIHTIKSRSTTGTSLSDHFFAKFGRSGTPACVAAQRRFTESLAAYSLICYMLQIKDRHNGNILLDDDGRLVHIDYGFLLSNSPGGVNFESAPFKLTRELLEVMDSDSDGKPSEMFDYFKVLMIQGFLALRADKQRERILMLVRIMSRSGFPCFKGGDRSVKALEKRVPPRSSLTDVQCVAHVLQLIAESLDAWRTRQYDYYQRVINGIL